MIPLGSPILRGVALWRGCEALTPFARVKFRAPGFATRGIRRAPAVAASVLGVLALCFAGVAPVAAATSPVNGAVSKSSAFSIAPPWATGVTHQITNGYGAGLHQGTNSGSSSNDYYALDFNLALDEAVYPIAGGTVIFAGTATGGWASYGNIVYVDHGNGYKSLYAHLDYLSVSTNQGVSTATQLGGAGGSGGWAVHLHFALYLNSNGPQPYGGQAVVPEPFDSCVKNGSQTCDNLANGDQLTKGGSGGSCTAPPLSSPGNGATVTSDTITFSWGNVGCSHNGWTLRVRTDTNFDDPNGNHLYDQGVGQTELSRQITINGHDNQTLYWAVRTANPVGPWTIWSFRITPTISPPGAPGNPSATAVSSTQIQLLWTYASGAAGYRIKRWDGVSSWPVLVDNLNSGYNSYTDGNLTPGATYWYYICAFNSGGETCITNWVTATLPVTAPSAPGNVTATGISSSQIQLSWGSASGANGYRVMRTDGHDAWPWPVIADNLSSATTSYTDGGLSPNSGYFYYVCAFNSGGETCNSPYVSATTQAAQATWSVSLQASYTTVTTGTSVTLTAIANQDVGPTIYYIWIVASDGTVFGYCGTGTTCTTSVSSSTAGPVTFYAVVADGNGASQQAASGGVVVTWTLPWSVTLEASATAVAAGNSVTLTAVADQNVGSTPYFILILTSDGYLAGTPCGSGTTCTAVVSSDTPASRTYHALVAHYDGSSAQATSGSVTVTWRAVHLVLSPASVTKNPGESQSYTATAVDSVGNSLGDVTSVTTFSISGGGSCTGASCSSAVAGDHTITGTDGAATGTAILTVTGVQGVVSGATYYPLTPTRLLDSRNGTGGLGIFHSHVAQTFQVTGGVVPSSATAVTGNLTVTQQTSKGFLYVGPTATDNPTSSTLNFPVGDDRANAVTVALGPDGKLSITFAAPTLGPTAHAIFDVTGYFAPDTGGATYHALAPTRLLDSRDGTGGTTIFSSHVAQHFQITGGVVPAGATAVTGNLTVTGQTRNGFLYVGPSQANNPTSSTLNFPAGDDRANSVTVALGSGGVLWVTYAAPVLGPTAQVIFDVTGYFTPDMTGAIYVPLTPTRLLDSRDGTGRTTVFSSHVGQAFSVAGGSGGVPANAVAVTGNLTVTQQTRNGFLYIGPARADNPTSSTLNFPAGDDRANAVTVALGSGGVLWITYAAPVLGPTAQAIFDVTGFFFIPAAG
jgi:murein DD-endopeptidase MepM/ murein hydrolase activator NlpD